MENGWCTSLLMTVRAKTRKLAPLSCRGSFCPMKTTAEPHIYLLLSCTGVCDDLTVCVDGTGHSTEQATHWQACIHESHTGSVQKAGQELRNG